MLTRYLSPFALAAVLAVGGCGAPTLTYQSSRTQPIDSFYTYGAGGRDLKLTVLGNPFAMPQPDFDRAVEAGMPGNGMLQPPTRLRLAPDPSAKPGYQLALAFGDPATSGWTACNNQGGAQGQPGGLVQVVAAFCVNGRVLSEAAGHVSADSPQSPAFRALLSQLTNVLFRPDEPPGGNGGDHVPP